MNTLSNEIRALVAARVATANEPEFLAIVGALCANDPVIAAAAPPASRFVNLDANAKPTTGDHVAVYDRTTRLVWSRGVLPGEHTHAEAMKAAAAFTLFGKPCRAPTVVERQSIIDYAKHSPALDTAHFKKESGYEWTSTLDASSPSGFAWGVDLGDGYCYRDVQGLRYHVRAVLAGQELGFDF
jgi:hypothetical protein